VQSVPVIVQPVPQEQVGVPESKLCELPANVSVRLRSETPPPPTFWTVPLIGYVRVPFAIFAVASPHDFVTVILQVLKLPKMIDFIEAVLGELPEVTLANRTLLKQGATPPKKLLRSIPPSWNCNAGTTPPGNPLGKPPPATLNPVPGD